MKNNNLESEAWECKEKPNGLACSSESGKQVIMGDDQNGDHVTVGNTNSHITFRQDRAKKAEFNLPTSSETFECDVKHQAGKVGLHCEGEDGREVNLTNAGIATLQDSSREEAVVEQRSNGKTTVLAENVDISEKAGYEEGIDARFNRR